MKTTFAEVSIKGRIVRLPATRIAGRTLVVSGGWLKVAAVHDEDWLEGEIVPDPEYFIRTLKEGELQADILTFAQKFSDQPKFKYLFEWDNVAVIRITSFADWWEGLPQESRKNVRRAERRGVVVKTADFGEELARRIKGIYDETPVRQGRRFPHYAKDLETVKRENSSYLERSQFIAAYHKDELIGFLKMVSVGPTARIMQILSKNCHFDKRPTNALLAKAVEVCSQRHVSCLIYGQYIYGNKTDSPVTEFKRRNGFRQMLLPRYYVPLTWRGKVAIAAGLHRGLKSLLPGPVLSWLLAIRQAVCERVLVRPQTRAVEGRQHEARDSGESGTCHADAASGK
ncbi:MAG: hypothetical protein ACLQU3_11795 [Limisphaerales bacterium]